MDFNHSVNFETRPPLLSLDVVAWFLNMDHNRVVQAVERGSLAWAWDHSVPPARRQELRIWRGSVSAWLRTGGDGSAEVAREDVVMTDILPNRDLYTSTLKRMFALHRTTLQHFIDLKLLEAKYRAPRDGMLNRASLIGRASIVELLRRRRVGFCGHSGVS